ncbi:Class II abasic (AP) endonuclease [Tulasnella sp. 332]|nr:Class II abasic (AP) endonuclease [Tulasnella sp. 332]
MKTSRSQLERSVALPGAFDGFFSFPVAKGGYSGVAVYSNSQACTPLKAEEGLTGAIQPKQPLTASERISPLLDYPNPEDFDFYLEDDGTTPSSFESIRLDQEGRALVMDYGLFVLVNVYCPAETSESRLPFKVNFHRLLEKRVEALIKEGREVIVLGDINIAATPLDHGEGSLASRQIGFYEHPARAWFKAWLSPEGPMIDAVRKFHPDREGMYTCWSVLLSARDSNYGSRIDYILITKGLLPWLKFGDIQADVRGSDHCPVYIDLHDSITLTSGQTVALADAMQSADRGSSGLAAPRICARQWDEFSGKQKLLSNFFQKKAELKAETTPSPESSLESEPSLGNIPGRSDQRGGGDSRATTPVAETAPRKRKQPQPASPESVTPPDRPKLTKKKRSGGQATIASFFKSSDMSSGSKSRPNGSSSSKRIQTKSGSGVLPSSKQTDRVSQVSIDVLHISSDEDAPSMTEKSQERRSESEFTMPADSGQVEADYLLACSVAEHEKREGGDNLTPPLSSKQGSYDHQQWKNLLAPLQPPLCAVHKEPTKQFVVNKPGPNKGKKFYVCSRQATVYNRWQCANINHVYRPVGPGYDKGRTQRLREEVNPQFRCDFFKWASDVRKESNRQE